jgi:glycine/D-amino acid oxidase-like deaminating enzyme
LTALCGETGALALLEASERAIDEIEEFCAAHAPEAEFDRGGFLWTATSASHVDSWAGVVKTAERLGRTDTFRTLSPEEVASRSGSPNHLAGVLEPSGAQVHPAHLVRALRRVALERGVRIHENSPMTRLFRGREPVVECPGGSISAGKVVLAMNAWATKVRELRSKLFVISSDVVATEPIPDRLAEIGWTGQETITDSQTLVCYYRTTRSGRIVFGKGGWAIGMRSWMPPSMERHPGRAAMVARDFRRYYPQLRDVALTNDWAGPIDRTPTGLPIFGRLGDHRNIVYGVGWSGNGVGPSVVGGKILASMALDQRDQWSVNGLVDAEHRRFPPEPFRYVGAHLVRGAIVRKERSEALGLRPKRVASALARLAPSGLEDKEQP